MTHDRGIPVTVGGLHSVDGFGERSDLIHFDQNAVGNPSRNPFTQSAGIRDEQVVPDKLNLLANRIGQFFPAIPVIFSTTIFDRTDGILF